VIQFLFGWIRRDTSDEAVEKPLQIFLQAGARNRDVVSDPVGITLQSLPEGMSRAWGRCPHNNTRLQGHNPCKRPQNQRPAGASVRYYNRKNLMSEIRF
jgi:hypothetical protein